MNPQRLAPNLRQLSRRLNRTGSIVHVAQTARREAHSGLVFGLKEPECAQPDRQECDHPRRAGCVKTNQKQNENGRGAERNEPEPAPLRLPLRSDVGNGDG